MKSGLTVMAGIPRCSTYQSYSCAIWLIHACYIPSLQGLEYGASCAAGKQLFMSPMPIGQAHALLGTQKYAGLRRSQGVNE